MNKKEINQQQQHFTTRVGSMSSIIELDCSFMMQVVTTEREEREESGADREITEITNYKACQQCQQCTVNNLSMSHYISQGQHPRLTFFIKCCLKKHE